MRIKSLDELKQIPSLHPAFLEHAGKEVTIAYLYTNEVPGIIFPEYLEEVSNSQ